ncbi:hypothetical protein Droror1_Dr00006416 [Drosera rotundifolia]
MDYLLTEYGLRKGASPEGDVYSFGILLLEIVSGKRPTDTLFDEGSDLHEWANNLYPNKLDQIIRQSLVRCARHGKTLPADQMCHDVILELIEIGLMCSRHSPST